MKSSKDYKIKDKIAVVYCEGDIIMGKGEPGTVGGDKYVEIPSKTQKER